MSRHSLAADVFNQGRHPWRVPSSWLPQGLQRGMPARFEFVPASLKGAPLHNVHSGKPRVSWTRLTRGIQAHVDDARTLLSFIRTLQLHGYPYPDTLMSSHCSNTESLHTYIGFALAHGHLPSRDVWMRITRLSLNAGLPLPPEAGRYVETLFLDDIRHGRTKRSAVSLFYLLAFGLQSPVIARSWCTAMSYCPERWNSYIVDCLPKDPNRAQAMNTLVHSRLRDLYHKASFPESCPGSVRRQRPLHAPAWQHSNALSERADAALKAFESRDWIRVVELAQTVPISSTMGWLAMRSLLRIPIPEHSQAEWQRRLRSIFEQIAGAGEVHSPGAWLLYMKCGLHVLGMTRRHSPTSWTHAIEFIQASVKRMRSLGIEFDARLCMFLIDFYQQACGSIGAKNHHPSHPLAKPSIQQREDFKGALAKHNTPCDQAMVDGAWHAAKWAAPELLVLEHHCHSHSVGSFLIALRRCRDRPAHWSMRTRSLG